MAKLLLYKETCSGKIMRRILRKVAEGKTQVLSTTTLLDSQVIDEIVAGRK